MSPQPPLHELPRILNIYHAEIPDTPPPPDRKECIICLRPFGQVDDPNDPDEEAPCHALQYPCGHYIGSECFIKLTKFKLPMVCSLCQHTVPYDKILPKHLETLANYWIFREQLRNARSKAGVGAKQEKFDSWTGALLRGTMNRSQAFGLWKLYMQVPLVVSGQILALSFINLGLWIFGWLAGKKYVEVWLLCRILGTDATATTPVCAFFLDLIIMLGSFGLLFKFRNDIEDGGAPELTLCAFCTIFGVRFAFLLLGWRIIVCLTALNAVTYGLLVAALLFFMMKSTAGKH